jgi:hypothetical protein
VVDLKKEWLRLLDEWDKAKRVEQSLCLSKDHAAKERASRVVQFSFEKMQAFQRDMADTFDMMIRCKIAISPDGDTALSMVLGDEIAISLTRRFGIWQKVADSVVSKIESLEREVMKLKKSQQKLSHHTG